jgi:hypothetical protein
VFELARDLESPSPAPYTVFAAPGERRNLSHPSAAHGVHALCFDDGALLVRADADVTLTVDGIASLLWPLLDGTRSLPAIAEEAAEAFGVPVAQAGADLTGWIDQLVGLGFVVPPSPSSRSS